MGLDTIELVMTLEEEFQIAIPNEVASRIVTLGDLRDCVVQILEARNEAVDSDKVWDRIKIIMRRDFGIAQKHLVPGAAIVADLGLD